MTTITNDTLDYVAGYVSEYLEGAYGMPASTVTPSMVEALLVNQDTTLIEEDFGTSARFIASMIRATAADEPEEDVATVSDIRRARATRLTGQAVKGTCPVCGQAVPLYKGVLRSHQQRPSALHPRPVTCPGGTRQPGPLEAAGHDPLF